MKLDLGDFRVSGRGKIKLKKFLTRTPPLYRSEKNYKDLLARDVKELSALQRLLYASNEYSLLLIFQAMDRSEAHV